MEVAKNKVCFRCSVFLQCKVRTVIHRVLCWVSPRQTPGLMICWDVSQDSAFSCTHSYLYYSKRIQSRISKEKRHMGQSLQETSLMHLRVLSHRTLLQVGTTRVKCPLGKLMRELTQHCKVTILQ